MRFIIKKVKIGYKDHDYTERTDITDILKPSFGLKIKSFLTSCLVYIEVTAVTNIFPMSGIVLVVNAPVNCMLFRWMKKA